MYRNFQRLIGVLPQISHGITRLGLFGQTVKTPYRYLRVPDLYAVNQLRRQFSELDVPEAGTSKIHIPVGDTLLGKGGVVVPMDSAKDTRPVALSIAGLASEDLPVWRRYFTQATAYRGTEAEVFFGGDVPGGGAMKPGCARFLLERGITDFFHLDARMINALVDNHVKGFSLVDGCTRGMALSHSLDPAVAFAFAKSKALQLNNAGIVCHIDTHQHGLVPVNYTTLPRSGAIDDLDLHPYSYQQELLAFYQDPLLIKAVSIILRDDEAGHFCPQHVETFIPNYYIPVELAQQTEAGRNSFIKYQNNNLRLEIAKVVAWDDYVSAVRASADPEASRDLYQKYIEIKNQQLDNQRFLLDAVNDFFLSYHPTQPELRLDAARLPQARQEFFRALIHHLPLAEYRYGELSAESPALAFEHGQCVLYVPMKDSGSPIKRSISDDELRIRLAPYLETSKEIDVDNIKFDPIHRAALAYAISSILGEMRKANPAIQYRVVRKTEETDPLSRITECGYEITGYPRR